MGLNDKFGFIRKGEFLIHTPVNGRCIGYKNRRSACAQGMDLFSLQVAFVFSLLCGWGLLKKGAFVLAAELKLPILKVTLKGPVLEPLFQI